MPDDPQGDTIHLTLPHRLVRESQGRCFGSSMQKILELANERGFDRGPILATRGFNARRFWNRRITAAHVKDPCTAHRALLLGVRQGSRRGCMSDFGICESKGSVSSGSLHQDPVGGGCAEPDF